MGEEMEDNRLRYDDLKIKLRDKNRQLEVENVKLTDEISKN